MPVAGRLTSLAKDQLKDSMITGFKGSSAAREIEVVKNYVLGINTACLTD